MHAWSGHPPDPFHRSGGGGTLRVTLPPHSAPISSTLDLQLPVEEVCKSAWTQSPLRGSAQHSSNEKFRANGNECAPMPWHALEMLPQCGNIRFFFAWLTDEITGFVCESACTWGLPQPIWRCSHLVHDHGQVDKCWEHSHRPFPSRKPSFHSISVMCRFWVCLFDTRSAHQNARWSKCPTHDHKHRVNPFNIAGSAQPRFANGFRPRADRIGQTRGKPLDS